jgi:oligopeptide transport system substrate-binding protein
VLGSRRTAARPAAVCFSVAILAVGLSACSHGTSQNGATPKRGGVLRVAVTRLGSLDPAAAANPEQQTVAGALFRTLTSYDATTDVIVPGLAAEWKASANQRQFDFVLRADARFSDGTVVTADDVMATLDRIAAKKSSSPVADLLAPVTGYGAVRFAGSASHLAGVTSSGPHNLRITLDGPLADLASLLSNPDFGVVSRGEAGAVGAAFPITPVTSGPFAVQSLTASALTLVPAAGSPAYLAQVRFQHFADTAAAYDAFSGNGVDWSLVPSSRVADASRRYGQGSFRPLAAELFYGFNLADPVFADRRVRQAIVEAIDRNALTALAYGGTAVPFGGLIVAGIAGHQADPCGGPCRFDPSAARALLVQVVASGKPLPSFAIDYDQDPTQDLVAQTIQADLEAVGLTVTLRAKTLTDYKTAALAGHIQLFRLGWVAAYPAADAFLSPLFGTGFATNLTRFSAPAVDALLGAARSEADPTKRTRDYQDAERHILAAFPVVPIAQFETNAVVGAHVHGLAMSPLGTFDPATVWIG